MKHSSCQTLCLYSTFLHPKRETQKLVIFNTLHVAEIFSVEKAVMCCDNCTHTWRNHFVAALAARRPVTVSTLPTHDLAIVLGSKGLIGQRLVALGTAEAVLVPVAVLMVQLLDGEASVSTAQWKMLFE